MTKEQAWQLVATCCENHVRGLNMVEMNNLKQSLILLDSIINKKDNEDKEK